MLILINISLPETQCHDFESINWKTGNLMHWYICRRRCFTGYQLIKIKVNLLSSDQLIRTKRVYLKFNWSSIKKIALN